MNDQKHEDSRARVAHEIEARFHDGFMDSAKFNYDVHTADTNLQRDGYLPNLRLSVDSNSPVNPIKHHPKGDPEHLSPSLPDLHLCFDPPPIQDLLPLPNPYRGAIQYQDPNRFRDPSPYRDSNRYQEPKDRKPNPYGEPLHDRSEHRISPPAGELENTKHDGEIKKLRLENRSSNHGGADALVYVRKDFDPSKPVHLAIYNHGFGSTVSSALNQNQIKEMMSHAQANTVLILPEWQANPGSRNGSKGALEQSNKFAKMVQEMMEKTPALQGATLNNVDRIDIIAHSAGYAPTETEIYKNPALSGKVHSITLLDSLYDRHGFDKWLGDNINDLAAGRKQFYNFSNSSTAGYSREQAKLVASMLRNKGLPTNNYVVDYGNSNGEVARHAAEMMERSIVFASTSVRHGNIPAKYIGATLAALNQQPVPNERTIHWQRR